MNESWAIVELMGHVKMAGILTEEERFGAKMGRIDIPQPDGSFVTQYFNGSSVYRITPCTEDLGRKVTPHEHKPVHPWTMKAICPPEHDEHQGDDEEEESEGEEYPF